MTLMSSCRTSPATSEVIGNGTTCGLDDDSGESAAAVTAGNGFFGTMSLFHDFKLKRRKIGSRCSSDADSLASNASSPDLAGSRVTTPPRFSAPQNIPSPSYVRSSLESDKESESEESRPAANNVQAENAQPIKTEAAENLTNGANSPPNDSGQFRGLVNNSSSPSAFHRVIHSSNLSAMLSQPISPTPKINSRFFASPNSRMIITPRLTSVFSQFDEIPKSTRTSSILTATPTVIAASLDGNKIKTEPMPHASEAPPRQTINFENSSQPIKLETTPQSINLTVDHSSAKCAIKQEREDVEVFDGGGYSQPSPPRRSPITPNHQDASTQSSQTDQGHLSPNGQPPLSHIQQQQQRRESVLIANTSWRGAENKSHNELKRKMDSPPLAPSNGVSGEKVILLGGSSVGDKNSACHIWLNNSNNGNNQQGKETFNLAPNQPSNSYSVTQNTSKNQKSAPTVIMGEAGGVRTMIWAIPAAEKSYSASSSPHEWSPPLYGTASPTILYAESPASPLTNGGAFRANEFAVIRETSPPQGVLQHSPPQQYQNRHSKNGGGGSPLNMERLWAGTSEQPALSPPQLQQQTQALNLTSSPPSQIQPLWSPKPPSAIMKNNTSSLLAAAYNHQASHSSMDVEDDQPMICMICEDKATGLHYGIITCEGCKGFFKRTVQNRRVYTCVADGICEINKAQRNRCQYCRFKKCLEQGMVLQAVREDRMPGGRNSGAVYNLYKVKYKKHKKVNNNLRVPNGQLRVEQKCHMENGYPSDGSRQSVLVNGNGNQIEYGNSSNQHNNGSTSNGNTQNHQPSYTANVNGYHHNNNRLQHQHLNGTILKTALTNPSQVVYLRQRLENGSNSGVSSSRDFHNGVGGGGGQTYNHNHAMIQTLIDCDEFQDIATLQNLDELLENKSSDVSEKLMQIGDSIVFKLVQWTKRLPFYYELPVEIHTRLLTHRWHELLVLTTSAYQAIQVTEPGYTANGMAYKEPEFNLEVYSNLRRLQGCLTSMMGHDITTEQLRQDVGLMVEKITHVTKMFRRCRLTMQEYVCLKVIIMLNPVGSNKIGADCMEAIQERYMNCLRIYCQQAAPHQPNRFNELLQRLPEVQGAAALLLESKMFYVPFLLNTAA